MAGGSSSKKRSRRKRKRERNPAAQLTDDLLVDILARVPHRSLCRFRCVSTRWRALIADPNNRRRLPQTLAGFFHRSPCIAAVNGGGCSSSSSESAPVRFCFTSVSAGTGLPPVDVDPSFSFLPDEWEYLDLVDSCNGLLIFRGYRYNRYADYIVLNPATEEWVAVPLPYNWWDHLQMIRLGFDPAFSSHFYIFELHPGGPAENARGVEEVKIYSSETRAWCHKQSGLSFQFTPQYEFNTVFDSGVLYVIALNCVIGAVDVKGETCRIIDFPRSKDSPTAPGFICLSQGRLHLANGDGMMGDKLAIWVLEDKDKDEWTLKHTVSYKHLVGRDYVRFGFCEFIVVAIHPDRNMVFFVFGWDENTLMSYDMDSGSVHVICNLGPIDPDYHYYVPYVPLFSKLLPDAVKQ